MKSNIELVKARQSFRNFILSGISLSLLLFIAISCKQINDPPAVFEEYQKQALLLKKKVLFISIDGVTGEDMKAIQPPAIMEMLQHAKYSWVNYADLPTSDGATWKSVMTGVSSSTHKVVDSTLQVPADDDDFESEIKYYPTFIERLQEAGKIKYSSAISPWKGLTENLFSYVDRPIVVQNDEEVKDSALVEVQERLNDLIIVNFNSVNQAGLQYGFSADVPEYREALTKVDEFIGEIMQTLKSRPSYESEEWLVIINSNHGGKDKAYNTADPRERKAFVIYYNDNYSSKEVLSADIFTGFTLNKREVTASLPANQASIYEIGNSGNYTMQCKVKMNSVPTAHAFLLGKLTHPYNNVNGWEFMQEQKGRFRGLLGNGSEQRAIKAPADLNAKLGEWYSLVIKVHEEPSDKTRLASFYVNGQAGGVTDITGFNIGNNTQDLVFGTHSNSWGTASQIISDVAMWNRALTDEEITSLACNSVSELESLMGTSLLGYWPCNEGIGDVFVNKSQIGKGKDMKISGAGSWKEMNPYGCSDEGSPGSRFVSQNKDIAANIFYWYGLEPDSKWKLDGTVWLSKYEKEFIKN